MREVYLRPDAWRTRIQNVSARLKAALKTWQGAPPKLALSTMTLKDRR